MRADNREKEAKEKAETDAKEALGRKKLLEKKIVKKANIIAKKELKKHIALDDISSDDESDSEAKQKLTQFKRSVVEKVMKTVVPMRIRIYSSRAVTEVELFCGGADSSFWTSKGTS